MPVERENREQGDVGKSGDNSHPQHRHDNKAGRVLFGGNPATSLR